MQFQLDVPWIPAWGIRYAVGVDGISLFLVLLTTFLVPLSVLGSYSYITTRERGFYALMLLLTAGMLGGFVSLDLFLFFLVWGGIDWKSTRLDSSHRYISYVGFFF